jgi:hypothetical protein
MFVFPVAGFIGFGISKRSGGSKPPPPGADPVGYASVPPPAYDDSGIGGVGGGLAEVTVVPSTGPGKSFLLFCLHCVRVHFK